MIIHRPYKGSLKDAMKNDGEFNSLSECLNTLVAEHNESCGHIFTLSINDLCIIPYGHDTRIGWKNEYIICVKPANYIIDKDGYKKYFGDLYSTPVQIFGSILDNYEREICI